MKLCSVCKLDKDIDDFYKHKNRPGGLYTQCKSCIKKIRSNPEYILYQKEYKKTEKAKIASREYDKTPARKEYHKQWHNANNKTEERKLYTRKIALKKYNLTIEDFENLLLSQNGKCAICKSNEPNSRCSNFHIDHDHNCCPGQQSCGKCIRGLLCARCNQGLGNFQDKVDVMSTAVSYLQNYLNKQNGESN